jgi:hypothetical protein
MLSDRRKRLCKRFNGVSFEHSCGNHWTAV